MINDFWNSFIDKSFEDLKKFDTLSRAEQQGAVLYEFYSESASGDGYEHFFSDLQYFGVDFDYAKELLVQLISDDKKLVKSYDKAKKYYDKKGEDGYYEKYSKYYVLRDKFLEEVINQFIQNNIELYNK